MNLTLTRGNGSVAFSELEEGEVFVGELNNEPYSNAFNIKIAPTQSERGITCTAREFSASNPQAKGKLVTYNPYSRVYRVKFANVELSLL